MKKERNIGIDLLRIISMFLIVLLHVLGNGGILNNCKFLSLNYQLVWFLEVLAYCAVNCYALISGYVGVDSKFKYSNIIYLWLKVVYYTLLITFVFFSVHPETISITNILNAVFPVLYNQYWYFTSYFCMFFFIPYFNILLNKLSEKESKILVLSILILFSITAMISPTDIFLLSSGYSVLWLSLLYLIGACIKKYNFFENWSIKKLLFGFFFCTFTTWFYKIFFEVTTIEIFGEIRGNLFLLRYNSISILLQSIFLLLLFSKLKITQYKKFIEYISSLSFSVYLIHAHPLIWKYVINGKFSNFSSFSTLNLLISILLVVIYIYTICICIDFVRYKLFKFLKIKQFSSFIVTKISNIKILKDI